MQKFQYYAPTEIVFGCGEVARIGAIVAQWGSKALLVSEASTPALRPMHERVAALIEAAGVPLKHFSGVIPNPTTDVVSEGARMAKEYGVNVVVGLGGGSSLDTAKAIAVEASHPGTAWDYLHYTKGPGKETLPIIAIGTTAGTGSQTTPCAVITNTAQKDKSAIWHPNIFPKVALVDPELTKTLPEKITAQTGFDAFCHNFEAYISVKSNPLVEVMALDGIRRIVRYLPAVLQDGADMEARAQMAWADTLGGLTNSSAGVTLPHGLGMQVGGHCPHVAHGVALAAIYPEFTRFTYPSDITKFARVGRIFSPALEQVSDEDAAKACCEEIDAFLQKINLWVGFKDLDVSRQDLWDIAQCGQVLGDYKNNPRVATIDEMYALLMRCYERLEVKV